LKLYCKNLGLVQTGKQDDLIQRLNTKTRTNLEDLEEEIEQMTIQSSKAGAKGSKSGRDAADGPPIKKKKIVQHTNTITPALMEMIKRNRDPEQIIILLNKSINQFVHHPTQLVFDEDKIVYGRVQVSISTDGVEQEPSVVCLTDVDVEQCKKYKFLYRLPVNLSKQSDGGGDDVIEELDLEEEEEMDNDQDNNQEEEDDAIDQEDE
jgi:hypothetical protein